ncbi:RHS repeat-associated core domain-containing protein [Amycolatopsis sp. CA-161197]|uniref:RHS repeat-associated core domain-containing protein n=1 Tax=Amycolatopsis sp. CA-161197 TaxID=3239922 RepID=UPI003D918AE2
MPDNSPGSMDYGWLGEHQRSYEHTGGLSLVQMGARPYSPLLGRFLSVDPEEGGSANDYDYVAGDPVNGLDLDGHGWFSSIVKAVTRVAEVVSWVPGPIGAIASGVAAAGNAIQENWGRAAMYAAGAITMGAAQYIGAAVRVAKYVRRATSVAKRSASRVTKGVAKFFRNGDNYVRIGSQTPFPGGAFPSVRLLKHYKKLGKLGRALNPIHIHLEWRKFGIDFNWRHKSHYKKW